MQVVICGAGVIGASIAYFLTERGIEPTVIERAEIACAASGKAGGFLARDWCDGSPMGPLARASFDLHSRLHRTLAPVIGDWGYRAVTTLLVRELTGAAHADPGSPYPWLDRAAQVAGVMGDTESTAQVHPEAFTRALMRAASSRGAVLRRGTVEDLTIVGSDSAARVTGVVVDGETLAADVVVLAMGPWTGGLAQRLPLPTVLGLRGNSVLLRPQVPVPAHCLFVETHDRAAGSPEIYPRPDGEVYVCGMADDLPIPPDPFAIAANDEACRALVGMASRLSSALAGAAVVRTQACFRPVTHDGLPLLGPVPGVHGAYLATAHNCWGILNAPASGAAMAELIAQGAPELLDLAPFHPGRFRTGHRAASRRA